VLNKHNDDTFYKKHTVTRLRYMSVIGETAGNRMRYAILIIMSIQCVYEVSGLLFMFVPDRCDT